MKLGGALVTFLEVTPIRVRPRGACFTLSCNTKGQGHLAPDVGLILFDVPFVRDLQVTLTDQSAAFFNAHLFDLGPEPIHHLRIYR